MYGRYETLSEAQLACTSDAKCAAVYDSDCTNNGPFTLCPIGDRLQTAVDSCVYVKPQGLRNEIPIYFAY